MVNKSLLYGIAGFILGALLVSIAATTFDKKDTALHSTSTSSISTDSMSNMVAELKNKTGDTFDKAFVTDMIEHHQSAVAMAKLSASHAKHQEVKDLSINIIAAQENEISQMQLWQTQWGYVTQSSMNSMHDMSH